MSRSRMMPPLLLLLGSLMACSPAPPVAQSPTTGSPAVDSLTYDGPIRPPDGVSVLPMPIERPRLLAAAERPTLVVLFTVDQLRTDYFDRYADQLTGGLGRMMRGGAFFTNAYQDHAVTETAPGHASTLSGRFPRSTGIIRNAAGVQDPQAPLIGSDGPGASPFRFRGGTLIDWMRLDDPRSRALSISRKDRGAILPLGRANQEVFWYDYAGRFTTSTYYADTLPTWLQRWNARGDAAKLAGQQWTLLLPADQYPEPDSVPAESRGQDFTFPHRIPTDPAVAVRVLPEYPMMDQLTLDAALEGVKAMALGAGPQPDLLAVSLSTTDGVGHRYGPDSREIHDHVLRLDRMLGAFMDSLYTIRDSADIVFALTSDHGVASFPEVRPGGAQAAAYHVDIGSLARWVGDQLGEMAVDSTAAAFDDGFLFVDRDAFNAAGRNPDQLVRHFVERARATPGVLRAETLAELQRGDTINDAITRRWLHMLPMEGGIEAVVTLRPHYVAGTASYAQHGSPHEYDALVPVIFYGQGIRQARVDQFARVIDIGPTLAHIVGVRPFEPLDGRVLEAALR